MAHELMQMLHLPDAAAHLRAADASGLLTRWIPELEASRGSRQPGAHAFAVLEHMLEAVAACDWMIGEIAGRTLAMQARPVGIQAHPELRWRSVYHQRWQAYMSEVVGETPRPVLFRLAALLHDNAKPQTRNQTASGRITYYEHQTIGADVARAIAARLGLVDEAQEYVWRVVREHMRPGQLGDNGAITPRTIRRYFHATHGCGPDVLLHAMADHIATRGPKLSPEGWWRHCQWNDALIELEWSEPEEPVVLLDGHTLIRELGMRPGPAIGRVLATVGEAQANGTVGTPEEALELARTLLRTSGGASPS